MSSLLGASSVSGPSVSRSDSTHSLVSAGRPLDKGKGRATAKPSLALSGDEFSKNKKDFWAALEVGDDRGVLAAINKTSGMQRYDLVNTPPDGADISEFKPHIPIGAAAAMGATDIMKILERAGAISYLGDRRPNPDQPAYDAEYWATIYGRVEVLKVQNKKSDNHQVALRALCAVVERDVVRWLKSKKVESSAFEDAMRYAVDRDDANGVRIFAKDAGVELDLLCSTVGGEKTSLLARAISKGSFSAAEELVRLGADPDGIKRNPLALLRKDQRDVGGEPLDGLPSLPDARTPTALAVRAGQATLVALLLQAGASRQASYLELAVGLPREQAIPMYVAMHNAGLQPKGVAETSALLRKAQENENGELYAMVVLQRGVLVSRDGGSAGGKSKQDSIAALDDFVAQLDDWTPEVHKLTFLAYAKANFESEVGAPVESKVQRAKDFFRRKAPAMVELPVAPNPGHEQALVRRGRG